jgi:hypothetical protein
VGATSRRNHPNPQEPGEVENNLRTNMVDYTVFADKMIHAVHGKSRYGTKAAELKFDDLVSPSQEAFALLLYTNGYKNWLWSHNETITSSETG